MPKNNSNQSTPFWDIIDLAQRNRAQMNRLLHEMSREEIISFHQEFYETAAALLTSLHWKFLGQTVSEDEADDIARWTVAQGKDYYKDALQNPEKIVREVAPHSTEQIYYEIASVFISRFDEDIWDADESDM
jgi:hypothetical protein